MTVLRLHLAVGALAIVSGLVALATRKGATLHRRSGTVFVYAMVSMSLTGALMAASGRTITPANVLAGVLTTYLVVTALTTVRPRSAAVQRLDRGAMLTTLSLGLASAVVALGMFAAGGRNNRGLPFVLLIFAVIAVPASVGDLRMIRAGGLKGAPRLGRHLWRMCAALFIATASFFLGAGRRTPGPLHLPAFRLIPLAVLVITLVWLWRLRRRGRRPRRGEGMAGSPRHRPRFSTRPCC
jgi:uncharacterized membrane protein